MNNLLVRISNEDLLQILEEKANIKPDAAYQIIKMKNREKILEQHKYSIKQGLNKRWYTYLPDDTKERGSRLVAKSTEEKVKDAIVEHYLKVHEEQVVTYKKMFEHWVTIQRKKLRTENTITRYYSDYARCIEGSEIENMDITTVNEETLIVFFNYVISRKGLTYQALINLAGNMRGVFNSARINKVISVNPFNFIDMEDFLYLCEQSSKTDEENVISEEELKKILKVVDEKLEKRPYTMTIYAILLASLTGMRVGELSGLAWNDIEEKHIRIWQSEKRIQQKGKKTTYTIEPFTKTKKERRLPMTSDIRELLHTIKDVQDAMGIKAQYVFQNKKGRTHSTSIVNMSNIISKKAGVSNKSIHCYRKTLSSNLRNLNVSTKAIAAMLGHTEEVNRNHYSYDTTDMEFKMSMLSKVNKNVVDLEGYKVTKCVIKSVIKSNIV